MSVALSLDPARYKGRFEEVVRVLLCAAPDVNAFASCVRVGPGLQQGLHCLTGATVYGAVESVFVYHRRVHSDRLPR